jgi:hypothetical protein
MTVSVISAAERLAQCQRKSGQQDAGQPGEAGRSISSLRRGTGNGSETRISICFDHRHLFRVRLLHDDPL